MPVDPNNRKAGDTSKAKPQLAVDLDMPLSDLQAQSILWPPVPMDTRTKHLLVDVCAARNMGKKPGDYMLKPLALIAKLALEAIEANRSAWEEEASVIARKEAEEKTEAQLSKEETTMLIKLKAIQDAMAAKRAAIKK